MYRWPFQNLGNLGIFISQNLGNLGIFISQSYVLHVNSCGLIIFKGTLTSKQKFLVDFLPSKWHVQVEHLYQLRDHFRKAAKPLGRNTMTIARKMNISQEVVKAWAKHLIQKCEVNQFRYTEDSEQVKTTELAKCKDCIWNDCY